MPALDIDQLLGADDFATLSVGPLDGSMQTYPYTGLSEAGAAAIILTNLGRVGTPIDVTVDGSSDGGATWMELASATGVISLETLLVDAPPDAIRVTLVGEADSVEVRLRPFRSGAGGGSQSSLLRQIVLVATTGNIALSGLQTVDGVDVQEGDRVLVCRQSSPADNGIYVASAGDWQRSSDYPTSGDQGGCLVMTEEAGDVTSTTLFMGWNQVPGDPDSPLRFAPIGSIDWTSSTPANDVQGSLVVQVKDLFLGHLLQTSGLIVLYTPEPADGDARLFPGGVTFWFDSTDGAASIHFKGKTQNGTVVKASVPMAP